jgi:uncharacterized SAM-binding protein YcdF (DUF218 family)
LRLPSARSPAGTIRASLASGSTTPGSLCNILVSVLENAFPRVDIGHAETITGVIALGGNEARIREAGRLARRYSHLRVLVSGAGEQTCVLALLGEGIDARRIVVETRSSNTHQNAVFATAAIRPKPGERWLLVTSAAHMPRAIGAFRRNAFMVEPWPIYDLAHHNPRPYAVAQHEWFGLIAYWLLGRTSALFPSPIEMGLASL